MFKKNKTNKINKWTTKKHPYFFIREKVSAVAIASVVVVGMTFSSFATGTNTALWGAFQKDNTHNGVIETETYTGGNISGHISKKDLERAAWSGIDSAPVIGTEGTGKTYAIQWNIYN